MYRLFGRDGIIAWFLLGLFWARCCLDGLLILAESGKCEEAKRELLYSTRLWRSWGKIPELQKLYEILDAQDRDQTMTAVQRVRETRSAWPKSRLEKLAADRRYWLSFLGGLIYVVVFMAFKS